MPAPPRDGWRAPARVRYPASRRSADGPAPPELNTTRQAHFEPTLFAEKTRQQHHIVPTLAQHGVISEKHSDDGTDRRKLPFSTASRRSRLVAASTRTLTRKLRSSPTLNITRAMYAQRPAATANSPISSRNSVPLSAISNLPLPVADGPGKCPLTTKLARFPPRFPAVQRS